jgi:hypothetical protein
MKAFGFTLVAVLVGIWVWSKLSKPASARVSGSSSTTDNSLPFQGPEIDPQTGAYLPPDAKSGTVSFPQDGINGGYNSDNAGTKL